MAMLEESQVLALADDPSALGALAECLRASGFRTSRFLPALDAESVEEILGRTAWHALLSGEDFAGSADPLERLFAWLVLGTALTPEFYETSLPPSVRDALDRAGLAPRDEDGAVRAAMTVVEQDGLILCADRLFELIDGELHLETAAIAMPPHFSTFRTLAALSQLGPGRSLLDVGTGAGAIALLAGGRYAEVAGIDLQPRAAAMARLNARLNDRPAYRFAHADCLTFAPGRRYDHIVFNSPGAFDLVEAFSARLGDLLAPGGACAMLAWLHLPRGRSADVHLAECASRWPGLHLTARAFAASPFSAGPAEIASGAPRAGSYLTPEFVTRLRADGVCQRLEVALTITLADGPGRLELLEEEPCAFMA